jgi:MoaA/NifB/PqqE/SkfB family radical SAM enzyme
MFDRVTGLNVLLDEITVPRERWALCPRYVSIALTNACDLACPYCYAPKNPAALDRHRLIHWLDVLDFNGCLGIGLGGGEPTLYPGLADVCRYAGRSTGLAVTLTTHGHWLNDSLLASLAGNIHFLRISMDGVGPTYEALRHRSFEALRNRLKILGTVAPFGINYVVNARTLPDLNAAIDLADEVGAAEFLLLPEQATQNSSGIDGQAMSTLRQWVSLYRGRVPLTVSEAGADGLPTCNPLGREDGLRAYAFISAEGILKKSSFEADGVPIEPDGLIGAFDALRREHGEERA